MGKGARASKALGEWRTKRPPPFRCLIMLFHFIFISLMEILRSFKADFC